MKNLSIEIHSDHLSWIRIREFIEYDIEIKIIRATHNKIKNLSFIVHRLLKGF